MSTVPSCSKNRGFLYVPETSHHHISLFVFLFYHHLIIPGATETETETETETAIATWIHIPSIPASFSAPLPSIEDCFILKLVEAVDSRSTALSPSSVAVLIDRDSNTPFQDMCESIALEACGSVGVIRVANSNTGPELFQMISSSEDFSMSIACLLISQESAVQLRS